MIDDKLLFAARRSVEQVEEGTALAPKFDAVVAVGDVTSGGTPSQR